MSLVNLLLRRNIITVRKKDIQEKEYSDDHVNARVIEAYTAKEAEEVFVGWGATEYDTKGEDYMGKSSSMSGASGI